MSGYIKKLISEGESLHLDFKYCISDSRKIARTLAAFANTEGGVILIGVRDNGSIAGIRSDEEIYMVETAVHLFCSPEIKYTIRQHDYAGKTLVEVQVEEGSEKPYRVRDEKGKWLAYFRHEDQNLLANRVILQIWKKEKKKTGVLVKFGKAEKILFGQLTENNHITLQEFRRLAGISPWRAESILANLAILKIISVIPSEKGFSYELNHDALRDLEESYSAL
ncbi:MAG: ATP-binding protein [Bacteroidales bacterium]|jgi:predicted HTH transcriptional regulator|nr:ATP-binding protein [Bacteroidales bacterium]